MGHYRRHTLNGANRKTTGFWTVYPLSILFVFHLLLVAYIASSYMEQFVSTEGVGALYTISSAISVLAFLFFSHALRAVGNVKLTLILAIIDIFSLVILGVTEHRATAIVAFVVFQLINPLLYLNIDIFAEAIIGQKETSTGTKRGLTLGIMSIAAVLAPLAMSLIIGATGSVEAAFYAAAAVLLVFVACLLIFLSDFQDPKYDIFNFRTSLRDMWLEKDVRNVMFSHLLLQIFFAWTVIYFPLYLFSVVGFGYETIGYIVAFALFAYVLVEWPVGIMADRWFGEKEIMALGFLVLAISISWVSFMNTADIWPWMLLLFFSRTGAAMVESTTEIYFFKHTNGNDADTISFFRLLRPLAAIIGALLGAVSLLYLPFNLIFVVLGLMMVPGILFTYNLKDTK